MSESLELHAPVIETDGGPWARHDHACSVCHVNKSVLDLATGMFQPCWWCADAGWGLRRRRGLVWRLRRGGRIRVGGDTV